MSSSGCAQMPRTVPRASISVIPPLPWLSNSPSSEASHEVIGERVAAERKGDHVGFDLAGGAVLALAPEAERDGEGERLDPVPVVPGEEILIVVVDEPLQEPRSVVQLRRGAVPEHRGEPLVAAT